MNQPAIWPFVPSSEPVSVSRAEGAYLYLADGSKILDAAGGCIVSNIGHGVVEVADAVRDALIRCTFVMPPWLTPQRQALVNELREHWLPPHLTRIHLASGGSEANEAAIKMAIQYHAGLGAPQRTVILTRSISYHGTTITTAAASGHPERKKGLEGILAHYPQIQTPYPLRCPVGNDDALATQYYLDDLEQAIEKIGANNIAALIAEPLNGSSGGAIAPPKGYGEGAPAILRQHGILLIMDEVMTGFGRTGLKFGSDHYGIKPDLLVAGKGLAGGYAPIAGVFGTDAVAAGIAAGGFNVMFHTFGALPQACAAATCVLQILRRDALLDRARTTGVQLKVALIERLSQHPRVAEIRGTGLLVAVEVVADRETLTPFDESLRVTDKIIGHGMSQGVFFYPGGTGAVRDIICIGPAFIIDDDDIKLIVNALSYALDELSDLQNAATANG
jgi:adenosylmethionine-8-amino-7-oxononanoate aminotransferase